MLRNCVRAESLPGPTSVTSTVQARIAAIRELLIFMRCGSSSDWSNVVAGTEEALADRQVIDVLLRDRVVGRKLLWINLAGEPPNPERLFVDCRSMGLDHQHPVGQNVDDSGADAIADRLFLPLLPG